MNIDLFLVPATVEQFRMDPHVANETRTVHIICIAAGNPTPVITIIDPKGATVWNFMGRATLYNVRRDQAGMYTCRATNGLASPVNVSTELVVLCMYLISFSIHSYFDVQFMLI